MGLGRAGLGEVLVPLGAQAGGGREGGGTMDPLLLAPSP